MTDTATHTPERTQAILKEFREFIDEAGEATDLDMWSEVHAVPADGSVWVQVDDDDTELSYRVTVTPIKD